MTKSASAIAVVVVVVDVVMAGSDASMSPASEPMSPSSPTSKSPVDDQIADALEAIDARVAELSSAPELVFDMSWELSLRPSEAAAELSALKVQRSIWSLLSAIATEDVCEEDEDSSLSDTESHRIILEQIISSSPILQRLQALTAWSEDVHLLKYKDEEFSIPMDWGSPYTQTLATSTIHLDPDCASRDGVHIHPEDQKSETRFWRFVWQLLLAGLLSRSDEESRLPSILQICQAFGHEWRAISLSGGLPYHISGDHVEGNVHRWMWRYTCRQMASQDTACIWERAVYGLLSGDVQNVYPVCETWVEFVWATCSCFAIVRQDELLYDRLKQVQDRRTSELLDDERIVTRVPDLSLDQIIEQAETMYFQTRPDMRKDSYHRIVKYLALNNIQEVFDELYSTMTAPDTDIARFYHRPSYIELAFRLYILLERDPGHNYQNAKIIANYIRY